jgi:WD40 repeat protein
MTLCGHTCPVWCLKATDTDVDTMSDLTIVSGGDDGRIKLWDLRSAFGGSRLTLTGLLVCVDVHRCCGVATLSSSIAGHTDMITSLSLDWTKLVSGSKDGSVRIWDVVSGNQLESCLGHSDTVSSVSVHDNHVASASWDGTVRCWFG